MRSGCWLAGLFVLGLVLCGCSAKTVTVADEAEFATMIRRIGPVLQKRAVVDEQGAYMTPVFGGGVPDAGAVLYERLSPAFRFRVDPSLLPPTFAATRAKGDSLRMRPDGFLLQQGLQEIRVALLGITDWNDDGRDDWLVLCRVRSPGERTDLDYYLAITDTEAARLIPRVLAVYDCRSARCRLLVEGAEKGNAGLHPESPVIEVEAGQREITPAPGSFKDGEDAVKEQKLGQ